MKKTINKNNTINKNRLGYGNNVWKGLMRIDSVDECEE
jgi:hypothetical protein